MSEYLSHEDLDAMSMALKVYDVDQGGWEHENKGLEFNANHTLKELVRAKRKDFCDGDIVRTDLAPDAMQYALRLARWTGFKNELVIPTYEIETAVNSHSRLIRTVARRIGAYSASEVMLADFVHKLDHEKEQQAAHQNRILILPKVSQALMLFALDSANEYDFRPRKAFIDRLSSLRERFDIPHPR